MLQKRNFLLFIFLFVGLSSFAQTEIGFRAAMNLAKVRFQNGGGEGNATVLMDVAVPMKFSLGNSFAIMPELHFTQKGQRLQFTDAFGNVGKGKYINNFIEIPLVVSYYYDDEQFCAYAGAGPFVGFEINRKSINKTNGDKVKSDFPYDKSFDNDGVKDNRIDVGLCAAGGFGYHMGPGKLILDIRMNFDMLDSRNYEGERPSGVGGAFNRCFAFGLGYNFVMD